tara:strand:- start:138 stop:485 length:348 start_codon:yes stop_codon:yes gene_type:complete
MRTKEIPGFLKIFIEDFPNIFRFFGGKFIEDFPNIFLELEIQKITGNVSRQVVCNLLPFCSHKEVSPEPAAKIEYNLWIQKVALSVPKMHLNRISNSKNQNISRFLKNLKTNLSQ